MYPAISITAWLFLALDSITFTTLPWSKAFIDSLAIVLGTSNSFGNPNKHLVWRLEAYIPPMPLHRREQEGYNGLYLRDRNPKKHVVEVD